MDTNASYLYGSSPFHNKQKDEWSHEIKNQAKFIEQMEKRKKDFLVQQRKALSESYQQQMKANAESKALILMIIMELITIASVTCLFYIAKFQNFIPSLNVTRILSTRIKIKIISFYFRSYYKTLLKFFI